MKSLWILFLSLTPVSENRGAILYASAQNIPLLPVFLLSTSLNLMMIPILLWLLHFLSLSDRFYTFWERWTRKKARTLQNLMEKYGWVGLTLFVAVPLPGTGFYSGCLLAALLGLSKRKSFLAIGLGNILAGFIVLASVEGVKFTWFQWLAPWLRS